VFFGLFGFREELLAISSYQAAVDCRHLLERDAIPRYPINQVRVNLIEQDVPDASGHPLKPRLARSRIGDGWTLASFRKIVSYQYLMPISFGFISLSFENQNRSMNVSIGKNLIPGNSDTLDTTLVQQPTS
jgi:hypothetical protein